MKKLLAIISAATMLSMAGYSQTNASSTNLISPAAWSAINFLSSGSNWMIIAGGIYDKGDKAYGGTVGALYALSPNVLTGMRLDYLNGKLFMPSMNIQLEVPIRLFNKVIVVPFTFGGIATPLTGKGSGDYSPVGMFGVGAAVRLSSRWDIVGDIERWTSPFIGNQYRLGVLYKF